MDVFYEIPKMKKIKVLNLYAGIGGNRKLWKDVEVTAIEMNPLLASIYKSNYPQDEVVIGDAHEYLRLHYLEFEFIWSSRPCKTHSKARYLASRRFVPPISPGNYSPLFPDLKLYEEIIFLDNFHEGKHVVENVKPFYDPLIEPTALISKHAFWANYPIHLMSDKLSNRYHFNTVEELQQEKGFDLSNVKCTPGELNKTEILRNTVHPKLGLHVFKSAFLQKQTTLS